MSIDQAFKNVPKSTPCLLIWRIENFQPVAVPKDQYGSFYEGDSYIVYAAKPFNGPLEMNIHFWLGTETTMDEAGAAAIKAVELDDHLGGSPRQYRETQGRESKVFLNYFKSSGGIKYLSGGAASGFNHVEHKLKPRLMHVKGKNCPRIKTIEMSWSSMNDGDAYILDIGQAFFIWFGSSCSRTERRKAMEYARRLRDDRGKGNLIFVEDGEESPEQMGQEEYEVFNEFLPVAEKRNILPAEKGGQDDVYERKAASNLKLWRCSDADGKLKVEEVAQKPLNKNMLDTNDVFLVDNGEAGIWVWCGRKANMNEKKEGMDNAMSFLKERNYPPHVQVTKIHESAEPTEFKALFHIWEKQVLPGAPPKQNRIARTVQTKFDAATMHSNPQVARETGMVDDGTGTKVIYRIERQDNTYEMVELKKFTNELYGGDSYVILYTYELNGRNHYIIYYWQGRKSTQDEKGVSARKAVELDDSLGGAAVQVRVVHGKEPNHFLAMFQGKLRIYSGGKAGWNQAKDEERGDTYLLQVRGTSSYNTKAEQVPCRGESLNSNDVFVLFSPSAVYIWAGKGSTGDEREMAKNVASISPRGYDLISEGQEKEDFWNLLGGKAEYSTSPRLRLDLEERPPRLFQCSNASGYFTVNEIPEFAQVDLVPDDVFILDAFDVVYVWIGDEARPEEKTMAMDAALEYIDTDPSGRDPDTPIYSVKQGLEDAVFVGYFGVWDRDLWSGGKSYEDLKKEYGEKNVSMDRIRDKSKSGQASFSDVIKFSYKDLTEKPASELEGVDIMHKEKHLKVDEFQEVFGMSYADFNNLPAWKQGQKKKDVGLF